MEHTRDDLIVFGVATGIIIALAFIMGLALRRRGATAKNVPLIIITLTLIALEIVKQFRAITADGDYNNFNLPFHFSSYFILFFALASFTRGRLRQFGLILSFVSSFVFIISFYLFPHAILGATATIYMFENWNAMHSILYHFLIVAFFAFMVALRLFRPNIRLFLLGLVLYTLLGLLSWGMAYVFDTNFANMQTAFSALYNTQQDLGEIWWPIALIVAILLVNTVTYFIFWLLYRDRKPKEQSAPEPQTQKTTKEALCERKEKKAAAQPKQKHEKLVKEKPLRDEKPKREKPTKSKGNETPATQNTKRHTAPAATFLFLLRDTSDGPEVLLQLRKGGWMTDHWDASASGHVDDGETMLSSIIREAYEEINAQMSREYIEFTATSHTLVDGTAYHHAYFFARYWDGDIQIMEPQKVGDLAWFNINNLPENIVPSILRAIQAYKNNTTYFESEWQCRGSIEYFYCNKTY
ncbi:MAG: NUDIX domain-containing protein [Firmicutes bacterium]|nr:NUDIX domain-containing protein [Bacillota bacterium]